MRPAPIKPAPATPPIAVRFAPSPTGYLHVGNARIALINWLFAHKHNGKFILRFDDTDKSRSSQIFVDAIRQDLRWLKIDWQEEYSQYERTNIYQQAIKTLKDCGRLYPCFDTPEELKVQRKLQASRGLPPVYDNRRALELTPQDVQQLETEGKKPHWRFRLRSGAVSWDDLVRGTVHFEALTASDPVVIREDGCPLYTLTSVVDDVDMGITHVVRGEDHVVNTAVQTQIFEALGSSPPQFAHISLLLDAGGKPLSKRIDSLSLKKLRESGVFSQSMFGYLAHLGTSTAAHFSETVKSVIRDFHFSHFGRAAPCFDENALASLNRSVLQNLSYNAAKPFLPPAADEFFWQTVAHNVSDIAGIELWYSVLSAELSSSEYTPDNLNDKKYLEQSLVLLPNDGWDEASSVWNEWRDSLQKAVDRKGKALLLPLRLALTGLDRGPDLPALLAYLGRERVKLRLSKAIENFSA